MPEIECRKSVDELFSSLINFDWLRWTIFCDFVDVMMSHHPKVMKIEVKITEMMECMVKGRKNTFQCRHIIIGGKVKNSIFFFVTHPSNTQATSLISLKARLKMIWKKVNHYQLLILLFLFLDYYIF